LREINTRRKIPRGLWKSAFLPFSTSEKSVLELEKFFEWKILLFNSIKRTTTKFSGFRATFLKIFEIVIWLLGKWQLLLVQRASKIVFFFAI